jgi:heme o synthase
VFRDYYQLTKPGIIRGNLIAVVASFLLAADGTIDWWLLGATTAGVALTIAAACVFNNYLDRTIDQRMTRTQDRALATHRISGRAAITYGILLGITGIGVLAWQVNLLTAMLGVVAVVLYVWVYGYYKRRSTLGTVVGSIPGALPPVAGYVAVTGSIDLAAGLLFLIMALWQMPHFYAIAMYRSKEYSQAALPVLPVVKGVRLTQKYILAYVVAFTLLGLLLSLLGYAGVTFAVILGLLGAYWFTYGVRGFHTANTDRWAKAMFGISLLVMLTYNTALALNAWLP